MGLANAQILDNFDNGNLNTNPTGIGSGFTSRGQGGVNESGGFVQMYPYGYSTTWFDSNDTLNPFGLGITTGKFRFGSVGFDNNWRRIWLGYRSTSSGQGHGQFPHESGGQGLYVSVISQDGYDTQRGNLIAINESGTRTKIASWNWADPAQLNNLEVTLRTTNTTYELSFSGASGGVPTFVTGAATGPLTGLGTIGGNVFRMGVFNQSPYYASAQVDAVEFSNAPAAEIAVETDSAVSLVSGGNMSFGVAAVGSSVSRTFTIRNTGNLDLADLTTAIGGPDAGEFSVTTAPVAPVSGPSGTTTFTVAFTPSDTGSKLAVLQIANNDADENPFVISMIGGPEPEITVEQPQGSPLVDGEAARSFPLTQLGKTSDLVFHVANSGSGPLSPLNITIDGTNAADFSISSAPSVPVGISDSTTFTVRFTPSGSGARTATLHLANNDVDESPFDINLTGHAYGPGEIITLSELTSSNGPRYPRGDLTLGLDGNFYGMTSQGGTLGYGTVFKMTPEGVVSILVNFDYYTNGYRPNDNLIQASDGNFYGMTSSGGLFGYGTAFKMTPAGVLTTLVHFDYYSNGAYPQGSFLQSDDGNFYGLTQSGGSSDYGTAFKLTPDGVLTTLVNFNYSNGSNPRGSLIQGSDGNFYGVTSSGGASGYGTVFKMTLDGTLTTLVNYNSSNGGNPYDSLIQAGDGNFYGMTSGGGTSGYGTAFKMTPAGVLTTLVNFDYYTNGYGPQGSLMQGSDGNFYGMTRGGGSSGAGTIFKMTPDGATEILVNFNGTNGNSPYGSLIQSSDGLLYGMTEQGGSSGSGTIFGIALPAEISVEVDTAIQVKDGGNVRYGVVASGATVIKTFTIRNQGNFDLTDLTITKSGPDAADFSVTSSPSAPLSGPLGSTTFTVAFSPADSSLRRATLHIANNDPDESPFDIVLSGGLEPEIEVEQPVNSPLADGLAEQIFPLTQQGKSREMVFHVSNSGSGPLTPLDIIIDGTNAADFSVVVSPATSLGVADSTTFTVRFTPSASGARTATLHLVSNDVDESSFDITLRGQAYGPGEIITLASLTSSSGPRYPRGDLTLGLDGNFYGMASSGGASGQGVIFKLTPGGAPTNLVNFDSSNGSYPQGSLIQATDGNFYGLTQSGGSSGYGTAFKMTPAGVLTTLVNFDYYSSGSNPIGNLIQASDGNFYGLTQNGGSSDYGTAFKLTPEGVLTTLVNFNYSNGGNPRGSLVHGNDGNFYGMTSQGGSSGYGTAFKITPDGVLTTLVNFNYSNGRNPNGSLILGSDGNFYGMTQSGGNSGYGTAFKITPAGSLTTLVNFNYSNGSYPQGSLIQTNDGNFYGMTQSGGNSGAGTVFKMTPAGVIETMVHFNGTNGSNPYGSVIQGSDGLLYGMTEQGGSSGYGTIFGIALYPEIAVEVDTAVPVTDGGDVRYGVVATGSTVSKTFTIRNKGGFDLTNLAITLSGPDAADFSVTSSPTAPVSGPDGSTTFIVAFTPSGSGIKRADLQIANNDADENPFDIVLSGGPEAEIIVEQPVGNPLVDGSTTTGYPLTEVGSASNLVFHVTNSGSGPLTPMDITIDGDHPSDFSVVTSPSTSVGVSGSTTFTVRFMPSGSGLRTASLHLATNDLDESPFDIDLTGQAYGQGDIIPIVTLGNNNGGPRNPRGDLTLGLDGNFYGMSSYGGANGQGSIFRMTPAGTVSVLVSFDYSSTGYSPNGSLIQGTDGNFYGMTQSGGPSDYGTAFKMTPEGVLTVLVNFNSSNGGYPYGSFIEGSDGNFYGLTSQGGSSGYGTAFKMTPEGTITTLVDFDYYTNGGYPYGSLIQGSDGDFYGMTSYGGQSGYGTIFKMTSAGALTTMVNFDYSNGYAPKGSLIQASDGNFYGMTESGGDYGYGTTFRMAPDGTLTTLVSFDYSNGYYPQGSLMQANDGHLYGMASSGGYNGYGVVFRLTLEGTLTVLDSFDYYTDGYSPYGSLTQGNDGLLYGMTYQGGPNYAGTIFGLSIGAGPLTPGEPEVLAVTPPKGLVFGGTNVRITGRDFTDATSVTFGGIAATNVVVLNRATITCTTPAHVAGPASVLVTTPLGTNPANTHFTYNEPPEIDVEQLAGIPQPSGSNTDFGSETAAPSENAITFDGQNDNVKVPTYSGINFTTQYTAETWMNVSGYGHRTLISKFEDDGDNRGWMINMGETGDGSKVYVTQSASGAWVNPIQWNTGFTPALNTWYHISVVFDSSLGSNQLKLYVNGSLYAQTSWYSTLVVNNADLYFGGYDGPGNGVNGGANSRLFSGALDDIRLWNVARTAAEIQSSYNQILAGNEAGLVGHWKFNQGVAGGNNSGLTTVLATTGSNGTLINSALSGTSSNWISRIATNLAGVATKTYTIFNTGAGPLEISSVSVAGGNATDFTVNTSGMLTSIPGGGSTTFSVDFSPSAPGASQTTLTLLNDDLNEASYTITLNGYGVGPDDPEIASITPASGPALGGTVVTISGGKFTGTTSVTVGGVEAAFTVDSDTQITCTTPPGSVGAASLRVTNASGSTPPDTLFTYVAANNPPTFSGFSASTSYQTAATISLGKLLTKAADPDADALSVTSAGPASAQGGTVLLQSGSIRYTPASGYSGADTFSVTITDARGAAVEGTVTVTVGANPNGGGLGANTPQLNMLTGGHVRIAFHGIPGRSYQVQRSTNLSNWNTIATVIAAANGAVTFTDEEPPSPSGYYRLIKP